MSSADEQSTPSAREGTGGGALGQSVASRESGRDGPALGMSPLLNALFPRDLPCLSL